MTSIRIRLITMQFLQFFIWGAWLISLGGYLGGKLHFEGGEIGAIFATGGIASIIMPGLTGIIADKWVNAERLYALLHFIGAGALFYAASATSYQQMYVAMLLNMLAYMPTLALTNTISYNALEKYKMDLVKDYPPIRVWGTVGFICAMWVVDLTGFKSSSLQLYVAGTAAVVLGLYALTLPPCPPARHAMSRRRCCPPSAWMRWCCSSNGRWPYSSSSPCCWAQRCKSRTPTATCSSVPLPASPNMPIRLA